MINFFKSLFWMIIIWSVLYGFEIHKGWTTDNLFLQTIFCTFFFLNALVSVPHYESREITFRLLNSKAFDLYEGVHFFPLLGLWGQIYTPPEYRTEEKSFIHFDARQVFRKREVKSRLEDFLISFIFPMFRKYEAWNFGLCIVLGLGLAWCSIKINQNLFNPKTESANQYVPQQQSQPQVRQSQNSYSQNNTNSNQTNYSYYKDKDGYEIRKDNNGIIEYKTKDGSWISEAEAMKQLDQKNIFDYYNPSITWNNLTANNDNYLIIQGMSNNIDYIEEEGFFVRSSSSLYYYPHVYVDGFDKDQEFFYQFFKVEIIYMSLANGQTWSSSEIELKDYVNLIRSGDVVNGNYRHVKFVFKDKFKSKFSWYIMDAGFGDGNTPFKICYKNECRYSAEEKNRLQINN